MPSKRRLAGAAALLAALLLILNPLFLAAVSAAEEQLVVGECRLPVAAVASGGGGVVGYVDVKMVYPGTGRVYLSTSPATEVDTQGAARLAAFAAALTAGVDFTRYDYIFDLESPSVIVGGPSAGLPMALATLAALLGLDCGSTQRFVATGMMLPDGSVGPVGGLKEKLQAAADWGANLFIVPRGQLVYRDYERVAERIGPLVIVRTVPVEVDLRELGSQLGVEVVEAATLADAAQKAFNIDLEPRRTAVEGAAPEGLDTVYNTLAGEYEGLRKELGEPPSWLEQLVNAAGEIHSEASEAASQGLYMASVRLEAEALALLQAAAWLKNESSGGDWSLKEQAGQAEEAVNSVELGSDESDVLAAILLWRAGASLAAALQGLGDDYTVPRSILGVDIEPVVDLARALWLARASTLVAGLDWHRPALEEERVKALMGLASDSIAYALALTGGRDETVGEAASALKSASAAASSVEAAGLASVAAGKALAAVASPYSIDPGNAASLAATGGPAAQALLQLYEWANAKGEKRLAAEAAYTALLLSWLETPAQPAPGEEKETGGGKGTGAPTSSPAGETGEEGGAGAPGEPGGGEPASPLNGEAGGVGEGLTVIAALAVAVASLLAGAAIAARLLGEG